MGDFSLILQGRYELLYAVIPSLVLAYVYANRFTVAGMGEESPPPWASTTAKWSTWPGDRRLGDGGGRA